MPEQRVGDNLFSRTALPIIAVGAVLLAAGIYGAWHVHRLHQRGSKILSENVASIRVAEELEAVAREIRHRLKRQLSSGNDRHLEYIERLLARGQQAIDEADDLAKSRREQRVVRNTQLAFEQLQHGVDQFRSDTPDPEHRETVSRLADQLIPTGILDNTQVYIDLNEQALDRNSRRNQHSANNLTFGLLLLGTCGGVTGLIAGYGIARLVNKTIVQLSIPIRDAAGKLGQVAGPVTWAAQPDFGDLESVLQSVSYHVSTVVERLQESERDRLRAEQLAAVGQLAAGIAHELRNPLTSMKAILQLASKPENLTSRDLEVLLEETERLEETVQSLLDFARAPQPHKTATDVSSLLLLSTSLVKRRCELKGVALEFEPPGREITTLADPAQLRQLFLNLLLNAIDVTPRGGKIALECRVETGSGSSGSDSSSAKKKHAVVQAEQNWIVVRVRDTGPGLPREFGQRIFEPFVTTKETGTGLGLSICRRIVKCHGGTISARDQPDGGAAFEARLPRESNEGSLPVAHASTDVAASPPSFPPSAVRQRANGVS